MAIAGELDRAEADGLIARDMTTIRPTLKGQRFLNELLERFLPAARTGPSKRVISICSPGTGRPS